ncbi:type IV secretion system DNA-binding domain-containing protein [Idiomarina abyssalis]|uniref:type IV secretion system DNA-binding domain-containing protein n=1 Tax=Idiomarina abyssalis TaxID=86102 RepID=UPI001C938B75|nr:type IV secretion system DNA-binding domain-containing protein [Idiomarina abyssalis]QZN92019.1 type IV secretion system DNA-binding domain-containing protein [Idiomarina abyssalis]
MRSKSTFSSSLSPSKVAPSVKTVNLPLVIIILVGSLIIMSIFGAYAVSELTSALSLPEAAVMTQNSLLNWVLSEPRLPSWSSWFLQLFSSEQYLNQAIVLSVLFLILLSVILEVKVLLSKFKSDGLVHVKGPKLIEGNKAIKRIKKSFKSEYEFGGKGLRIHPNLQMPQQRENQAMLILGSVGSGKTQFLLPIVKQVVNKRSSKSVIFDYKGDFTEYFYGKNSVGLYAPWDKRSFCWDIKEDLKTSNDALLFAEAMLPSPKGQTDPMWILGSRQILTGCVMAAQKKKPDNWGWGTLSKILSLDIDRLHRLLRVHYPIAANLLDKDSKTSASFYQTLQSYCQSIHNLAEIPSSNAHRFSIKRWLKNKEPECNHIILQSNPEFAALSKSLGELFLYFSSRYLLAMPDDMQREVYFILDEAAHLQFKQLPELISTGRSKGSRVFIGVQDLGLFSEQFSESQIDAMSSMVGTIVSFRLSSLSKFTQKVSDGFGKRVVERLNVSNSDDSNRKTASWQYQELPLVSATDLMALSQAGKKGVSGYIKFAGTDTVAKLTWPLTKFPKIAVPVIRIKSDTKNVKHDSTSRYDEFMKSLESAEKLSAQEGSDA